MLFTSRTFAFYFSAYLALEPGEGDFKNFDGGVPFFGFQ